MYWLVSIALLLSIGFACTLRRQAYAFRWERWMLANAPISWVISTSKTHPEMAFDRYRRAWFVRGAWRSELYDHWLDIADAAGNGWADTSVVTEALIRGELNEHQRQRFFERAVREPHFVAHPQSYAVGEPVRFQLNSSWRVGNTSFTQLSCVVRTEDGKEFRLREWPVQKGPPIAAQSEEIPWELWSAGRVTPGPRRLQGTLTLRLFDANDLSKPALEMIAKPPDAIVHVVGSIPDGEAANDVGVGEAIAKTTQVVAGGFGGKAHLYIGMMPISSDRNFKVIVRAGDEEKRVMSVTAAKDQHGPGAAYPLPSFAAAPLHRLTVILEGEGQMAAYSASEKARFWRGRIIFENVSVTERLTPPDTATTQPYRLETNRRATTKPTK